MTFLYEDDYSIKRLRAIDSQKLQTTIPRNRVFAYMSFVRPRQQLSIVYLTMFTSQPKIKWDRKHKGIRCSKEWNGGILIFYTLLAVESVLRLQQKNILNIVIYRRRIFYFLILFSISQRCDIIKVMRNIICQQLFFSL